MLILAANCKPRLRNAGTLSRWASRSAPSKRARRSQACMCYRQAFLTRSRLPSSCRIVLNMEWRNSQHSQRMQDINTQQGIHTPRSRRMLLSPLPCKLVRTQAALQQSTPQVFRSVFA